MSYKESLNEISDLNLNLYKFLDVLDKISNSKSSVSYLTTMAIRIIYMHKLLKNTGSFYLHCDPTMSHYLKIVCDFIFGEKNFRNEIIWSYRKWATKQSQFCSNHDVILFYSKSNVKQRVFNYPFMERAASTLKRFGKSKIVSGYDDSGKRKPSTIENKDSEGVPMDDVWNIGRVPPIKQLYSTEKPEALLERIILASSNEGDLVADLFCGCGTSIVVAQRLKRNWIGVDISHLAVKLMANRLVNAFGNNVRNTFVINGFPKDIDSAKELAQNTSGGRLKFEEWIVEVMLHGVLNENRTQMGYDGYFTFYLQDEKQIGMIEVKSGGATPTQLNHFIKTVESKKGSIGIFVCFDKEIKKSMRIIAKEEGFYNEPLFGRQYQKIQIISVEELLNGVTINVPHSTKTTFKVAPKDVPLSDQTKLSL